MTPKKEISDCIKEGNKTHAVKLVRDYTGVRLKVAKDDVDEFERTMKKTSTKFKQLHYLNGVSVIDGMEGHAFEYFCADLLRRVGFSEVTVTPGSGDQGVDVLAVKDGVKFAIQCKNYASALNNTPIQEVSAGKQFYGCHVGVVMTNSTFTPGAIQLATATNVLLWDRRKLDELISMASGLESLGISDHTGFDSDGDRPIVANTNHPRKGLRLWSKICIGWSALCFILFVGGLVSGSQDVMMVGLGEGLFVLVLGLMLSALAKTEKGDPYIYFMGKDIKKYVFVILCIAVAYALLFAAMDITGGSVTVSKGSK